LENSNITKTGPDFGPVFFVFFLSTLPGIRSCFQGGNLKKEQFKKFPISIQKADSFYTAPHKVLKLPDRTISRYQAVI